MKNQFLDMVVVAATSWTATEVQAPLSRAIEMLAYNQADALFALDGNPLVKRVWMPYLQQMGIQGKIEVVDLGKARFEIGATVPAKLAGTIRKVFRRFGWRWWGSVSTLYHCW